MIEEMCRPCHERAEVGEFKAGRARMVEGLKKTGAHTAGGAAATDYTYLQCADCGTHWMLKEDRSSGHPSRYLSRRSNFTP